MTAQQKSLSSVNCLKYTSNCQNQKNSQFKRTHIVTLPVWCKKRKRSSPIRNLMSVRRSPVSLFHWCPECLSPLVLHHHSSLNRITVEYLMGEAEGLIHRAWERVWKCVGGLVWRKTEQGRGTKKQKKWIEMVFPHVLQMRRFISRPC